MNRPVEDAPFNWVRLPASAVQKGDLVSVVCVLDPTPESVHTFIGARTDLVRADLVRADLVRARVVSVE